jgi:hypothetical protein
LLAGTTERQKNEHRKRGGVGVEKVDDPPFCCVLFVLTPSRGTRFFTFMTIFLIPGFIESYFGSFRFNMPLERGQHTISFRHLLAAPFWEDIFVDEFLL